MTLSEEIIAALKRYPKSTIRDLSIHVNGTKMAIATALSSLREQGKVDATEGTDPAKRQWFVRE